VERLEYGLILLAFLLTPVAGFSAGFWSAAIRIAPVRWIVLIVAIMLPLTLVAWPLLVPWGSEEERFGTGFALVLFSLPLALWMFSATGGAFVGSARRRGKG